MTELYAHKWVTINGDIGGHVFEAWRRELADVPLLRIKEVLDVIADTLPEWPPSLVTFMRLCKESADPIHKNLKIEHYTPCTQSVANAHLAKMREMAGLPPKELPKERIKRPNLLT